MSNKLGILILAIGFTAFLFAGSLTWACTGDGKGIKLSLKMRNLEPVDHPIPIIIEIDGFTAHGSESGDSCGAASILPEGLAQITVSIVHEKTGESVGFGEFRPDTLTRDGFCGQGSKNCVAFISKVTQQGIKAETPLKMIIEALPEGVLDARQTVDLAVRLVRDSVFVAGKVDKNGNPHHHLSVARPNGIEIVFLEGLKDESKKGY